MTNIARTIPQLPPELLEMYNDEQVPLYHPVRGSAAIKQVHRLTVMLKQEAALLLKIRYKQKNQHKSATWWRHVSGSQRVCARLLEQLENGLVLQLPSADDKQPVLAGPSLFLLTEGSLRILLLIDETISFHIKTAAYGLIIYIDISIILLTIYKNSAVQQLLRAALFMPLAMTLKALIARLHSIWTCLKDELQVFLLLLRSSPKKKSQFALDLDEYICSLPFKLRKYWVALSPKKSKSTKNKTPSAPTSASLSASLSASATSSALPSRTRSPAITQDQSRPKPRLAQDDQFETQDEMQVERQAESRSLVVESESTVPVTEAMPVPLKTEKVKKVKKRKRAKPADDIDAIFAGL